MAISKKELYKTLLKDFETTDSQSNYSLKRQCDRLVGFLDIAIEALVANGQEDFVLLKHDDLRKWYMDRQRYIQAKQAELEAKARKAEVRQQALLKLTEEEKIALGVKKK